MSRPPVRIRHGPPNMMETENIASEISDLPSEIKASIDAGDCLDTFHKVPILLGYDKAQEMRKVIVEQLSEKIIFDLQGEDSPIQNKAKEELKKVLDKLYTENLS